MARKREYTKEHREKFGESTEATYLKNSPEARAKKMARVSARVRGARASQAYLEMAVLASQANRAYEICGDERLEIQVDHIVPVSRGGSWEEDNLRFLPRWFNCGVKNKQLDEELPPKAREQLGAVAAATKTLVMAVK